MDHLQADNSGKTIWMLIVTKSNKMKSVKKKTLIWPHGKEEMVVAITRKCTLSREVITN